MSSFFLNENALKFFLKKEVIKGLIEFETYLEEKKFSVLQ